MGVSGSDAFNLILQIAPPRGLIKPLEIPRRIELSQFNDIREVQLLATQAATSRPLPWPAPGLLQAVPGPRPAVLPAGPAPRREGRPGRARRPGGWATT